MFGEPSTWNMKVGEFIETQLPKQKPKELLDLQEQNRKQRLLDSLQKIGPGLMDESLDFIRRKELKYGGTFKDYINREDKYEDLSFEEWLREDKAEGGRIGFKSGTPFQITDEVLEKIDDLIKNTNLDLKTIGKQIGFGTDKKPMDSKSKVFQEYIKKYGRPDQERLQTRGVKLTADSPYVKKVIKLREELGSTNAVAKELGKENKTIRNVLSKFRPDLMGERNVPGPETGAKAIKKRAQEAIKEAKKKAKGAVRKAKNTVKKAKKVATAAVAGAKSAMEMNHKAPSMNHKGTAKMSSQLKYDGSAIDQNKMRAQMREGGAGMYQHKSGGMYKGPSMGKIQYGVYEKPAVQKGTGGRGISMMSANKISKHFNGPGKYKK